MAGINRLVLMLKQPKTGKQVNKKENGHSI